MAIASPRASARGYRPAPLDWSNPREWMREIAEVVNNLLEGKDNATGSVTFTVDSLTTLVKDRRCGPDTWIGLSSRTANAGGEVGIWFSNVGTLSGGVPSFTINHAFDNRSDRTFRYVLRS